MTSPSAAQPAPELSHPSPTPSRAAGAGEGRARDSCRVARADEGAVCPACGDELRLWASYYRCRNCGYKDSCCF